MSKFVDLNSDIGESFGTYHLGMDEAVMEHVTSVNIACGWHAGDPVIMEKTIRSAKAHDVAVGAHPGYPDLLGFGRRKMAITPEEARAYMIYQLGAFTGFAQANGMKVQHMKLHGAYYNTVCNDKALADAVLDGIEAAAPDVMIVLLSGSYMAKEGIRRHLKIAQEVFADRGYNSDGTLVNRNLPGAFVRNPTEAIERVKEMVLDKCVTAVSGEKIEIIADSICVHGDNPQAVAFAEMIRKELVASGITVASLGSWKK